MDENNDKSSLKTSERVDCEILYKRNGYSRDYRYNRDSALDSRDGDRWELECHGRRRQYRCGNGVGDHNEGENYDEHWDCNRNERSSPSSGVGYGNSSSAQHYHAGDHHHTVGYQSTSYNSDGYLSGCSSHMSSHRFPHAGYAASEAGKSDIATVCSGSVVEDIDVASVTSTENNNNGERMPRKCISFSKVVTIGDKLSAANLGNVGSMQVPVQQDSSPIVLNDMGPPLSRMLLVSASQADSLQSSTGDAPSDVVTHVDTDDGVLISAEVAEIAEIDGHFVLSSFSKEEPSQTDIKNTNKTSSFQAMSSDTTLTVSLNASLSTSGSGRVSPGGTVYKGRGIRRYQGRYMHLPLKRFHQNRGCSTEDHSLQMDTRRQRAWSRSRSRSPPEIESNSCSWRRARSRSRSPTRNRSNYYHSRNQTTSPSVRQLQYASRRDAPSHSPVRHNRSTTLRQAHHNHTQFNPHDNHSYFLK